MAKEDLVRGYLECGHDCPVDRLLVLSVPHVEMGKDSSRPHTVRPLSMGNCSLWRNVCLLGSFLGSTTAQVQDPKSHASFSLAQAFHAWGERIPNPFLCKPRSRGQAELRWMPPEGGGRSKKMLPATEGQNARAREKKFEKRTSWNWPDNSPVRAATPFPLAYVFWMTDGLDRARSLMWLPITIPFLLFVGLPTALSVSLGVGMIVGDFEDRMTGRPLRNQAPLAGRGTECLPSACPFDDGLHVVARGLQPEGLGGLRGLGT